MREKLWNRLVIAFTGLLLLAAGVLFALCAVGFTPNWLDISWLESKLTSTLRRGALCGGGVVLCLLGLHNVWMLFRGKKIKGFIMQRTDYGDMSISMKALETMVHKCVEQHQELEVRSTKIFRVKNGILVQIRVLLETGVNIPLTVNALQKQIKQYIASCSGVDVQEVRVLVETDAANTVSGKKQQEIVLNYRKPTIIPEPFDIQKEKTAWGIPTEFGESWLKKTAQASAEETLHKRFNPFTDMLNTETEKAEEPEEAKEPEQPEQPEQLEETKEPEQPEEAEEPSSENEKEEEE